MILLSFWPVMAEATSIDSVPAVVILLGPVRPGELWDPAREHIDHLGSRGVKGLMSINIGSRSAEGAYLALGTGRAVPLAISLDPACNRDEWWEHSPAIDCWQRRLGRADAGAQIVHLGISQLKALGPHHLPLGLLGDILVGAGRHVTLLGNADGGGWHRQAVTMAMTSLGTVERGNVGPEFVKRDDSAPFGVRTDFHAILRYLEANPDTDTLFVHAGDVERALRYRVHTSENMAALHVEAALDHLNRFVGELLRRFPPDKTLWAIIPASAPSAAAPMVPIILAGPSLSSGLALTATTGRPGLVAHTDILPTLLAHLRLPVPDLTGKVITGIYSERADDILHATYLRAARNYDQRSSILKTYVTVQGFAVLLGMVLTLLGIALPRLCAVILLWLVLLPLSMLLWPYVSGVWGWVFFVLALVSLLVATGCYRLAKGCGKAALGLAAGLVTVVLAYDLVGGQTLMLDTPFGYSSVIGARFYGLGNEYAGYWAGMTWMGCAIVLEHGRRRAHLACILWLTAVAILMAGPGINLGGTLTMVAGSMVLLHLRMPQPGGKAIRVMVPASLAGVVLAANALLGRGHLGNVWARALAGDMHFVGQILSRKLDVSLRLLNWTIWSQAFLVLLGTYLVLSWRPAGLVKAVRSRYPCLHAGTTACAIGSIVAIFTNDSGIVVAATCMVPGVTGWLLALTTARTREGR